MIIHVRTAHHRCQAQSVAQDTEQIHGKHDDVRDLLPLVISENLLRSESTSWPWTVYRVFAVDWTFFDIQLRFFWARRTLVG